MTAAERLQDDVCNVYACTLVSVLLYRPHPHPYPRLHLCRRHMLRATNERSGREGGGARDVRMGSSFAPRAPPSCFAPRRSSPSWCLLLPNTHALHAGTTVMLTTNVKSTVGVAENRPMEKAAASVKNVTSIACPPMAIASEKRSSSVLPIVRRRTSRNTKESSTPMPQARKKRLPFTLVDFAPMSFDIPKLASTDMAPPRSTDDCGHLELALYEPVALNDKNHDEPSPTKSGNRYALR